MADPFVSSTNIWIRAAKAMSITPKRIAITGAEGVIGTVLRRGFPSRYEVVPITRSVQPFHSLVADVTDLGALVQGFTEVHAVIHLAAAAGLNVEWNTVLSSNIVGTRNVFEAARLAGVRAVVFASSGHVLGLAEERAGAELYSLRDDRVFEESAPVEPDSLYAASKAFGEALGRYYSASFGLRVVCVRLGMVLPNDNPWSPQGGKGRSAALSLSKRFPRVRAKWLSHRDCCQLFVRCIEAESVRYAIVFGTSNNPRQIWSLATARDLLKYEPQDAAPESLG
jgi:NAD+ dependent glucose-6-phosphate dehydrogenase